MIVYFTSSEVIITPSFMDLKITMTLILNDEKVL